MLDSRMLVGLAGSSPDKWDVCMGRPRHSWSKHLSGDQASFFGALRPGSKLKLDTLAQRYPASLPSTAQALNNLASDGFVDAWQLAGFVTP
jgi:hypothetical protein